jgi:thiol-disulfide isomerase/thioredoxin
MTMRRALATGAAVLALSVGGVGADEVPSPAPSPAQLAAGDVVPPFDAEGIDGVVHHVAYGKQPTILLFFLSGCPHCHKQIPEWNRAYERRPPNVNVIGVMLDHEPPGFFAALPIAFPVVRAPNRELGRTFKVARVPMTVRVGPGGKVEDVGSGPTDPIRLGELFRK